ncbi:MAG: hypothetical protein OEW19_11840, partial [Acidobacteriota bacterium]|nr:hypothetical protein [Acidobacteriota bacterium]
GVLRLTEIGCFVETTRLAVERERVSLMIFFSPVRSLRLTGEVVAVEPDRGCVLRFSNLGPDVRRSLRVEIREGLRAAPRPLAAELSLTQRDGVLGSVRVAWQVHRSDLHANQW